MLQRQPTFPLTLVSHQCSYGVQNQSNVYHMCCKYLFLAITYACTFAWCQHLFYVLMLSSEQVVWIWSVFHTHTTPETPYSETYIFPYKLLLLLSFVSCPVETYYSIFHLVISQFCVYLFIFMKFIFYDSRMMPSLLKDSLAFDFCVITIVSYYFHKYYILCSC